MSDRFFELKHQQALLRQRICDVSSATDKLCSLFPKQSEILNNRRKEVLSEIQVELKFLGKKLRELEAQA